MNYTYADMHCDSILRAAKEGSQSLFDGNGMQSFKKQIDAKQLLQFYAIFFPPKEYMENLEDEAFYKICREALLTETQKHFDEIGMAYTYEDILENQKNGKVSAMLTIEDGRMVQGSMERLKSLYDEGVRAIALTWNFANCFGSPNSKDPSIMNQGLTEFGIEAIQYMQDLGILVDVSHLSDGGFYDVLKYTRKPFIASHSNCRALTNHTRNLTDDMIVKLSDRGGISGLNFCPEFCMKEEGPTEETVDNLARHIEHMYKIGGEDFPAIGTDFDGIRGKLEIGEPSQLRLLFERLEQDGISSRIIEKFAYKNVLRVIKESIK